MLKLCQKLYEYGVDMEVECYPEMLAIRFGKDEFSEDVMKIRGSYLMEDKNMDILEDMLLVMLEEFVKKYC